MNPENDPDTLVTLDKTVAMLQVLKARLTRTYRLPSSANRKRASAVAFCNGAEVDIRHIRETIESLPEGKAKREILEPLGF